MEEFEEIINAVEMKAMAVGDGRYATRETFLLDTGASNHLVGTSMLCSKRTGQTVALRGVHVSRKAELVNFVPLTTGDEELIIKDAMFVPAAENILSMGRPPLSEGFQ